MHFASDNWAGAHPAISARLAAESGFARPYGAGDLDLAIENELKQIFETDLSVFFVSTGTAANSLALASVARPGGIIFCHSEAHVMADECGAPEFFTNASRLVPVPGADGRMEPTALAEAIARFPQDAVHQGRATAVTITQATEAGTVYSLSEIDAIAEIARAKHLPLHMDGARFANALVALNVSPAEMTWKRGIDILSFGATKNGCWCAEALIFFRKDLAADIPFLRKRSAQLFSKSRFISAQLDAYLADDLWLNSARHANAMADRLRNGLLATGTSRLGWETTANEVFAIVPRAKGEAALAAGAAFYEWPVPHGVTVAQNEMLIRLVTSFASEEAHVEQFLALMAG